MIGVALEIAIVFFFKNFTYTFGGKLYVQTSGGPIGARLTMCAARLVLQQWREDFKVILEKAEIKEKLSRIYVDDNRCIVEKLRPGLRFNVEKKSFEFKKEWVEQDEKMDKEERTVHELRLAMNSVNDDLKFTMEREKDFSTGRLPTLAFEIWSSVEGIRHSYYEKPMRNQVLTEKRSSMSEHSKMAILTNELNRRFLMMDDGIPTEEKIEKIDQYTQQLYNSGYAWPQIRDIIVSSLKGLQKIEIKRKEKVNTEQGKNPLNQG